MKKWLSNCKRVINNTFFMLKILWNTDKAAFFVEIAVSAFSKVVEPISVLLTKAVIDNITTVRQFDTVVYIFLVYIALKSISLFTMNWLNNTYSPKKMLKYNSRINNILLNKMKEIDAECFDQSDFYNKYTRAFNEAERRAVSVFSFIIGLPGTIAALVLLICSISIMSPLIFVFVLLSMLLSLAFNLKNNNLMHEENVANTGVYRIQAYVKRIFYQPHFIKDLKLDSGLSDLFLDKYNSAVKLKEENIKIYGRKTRRLFNVQGLISNILLNVAILLFLTYQVIYNNMSLGTFLALESFQAMLPGQLESFFRLISKAHENSLFIDDLRTVLDYKSKIESDTGLPTVQGEAPEIVFDDVSFSYFEAENNAVDHVSFKIGKGEKIAVVGYNGAGKSTLIKLLCRLYDCKSGAITVNGKNIKEYNAESYRNNISCVFQDYNIYGLTIAENVLRKASTDKEEKLKVSDALRRADLSQKVDTLPNGLNTILSPEFEGGITLSGGEQQKMAIAHSVIKKAGLLLLDEPSSSLDPEAEYRIFRNLLELAENKTVVLISHRLSNVTFAEKIIFMKDGKIAEMGSHEELMQHNGEYARLFTMQKEGYENK